LQEAGPVLDRGRVHLTEGGPSLCSLLFRIDRNGLQQVPLIVKEIKGVAFCMINCMTAVEEEPETRKMAISKQHRLNEIRWGWHPQFCDSTYHQIMDGLPHSSCSRISNPFIGSSSLTDWLGVLGR
jgi:hypothetical protein